ncbi:MAG: hypothetical protein KA184_22255 [Candidatus Hydrogenedentes bacterium]|nr:hypothetical protein [Candidatus Hydrogenedentota bacterium]
MAKLEEIEKEMQRIRSNLATADRDLLAGNISVEIYDRLAATNLELLKQLLEQKQVPLEEDKHQSLQDKLKSLLEYARGLARMGGGGGCPICTNKSCYVTAQLSGDSVEYGVFCFTKNAFYKQGGLPVPKYLQEFLAKG